MTASRQTAQALTATAAPNELAGHATGRTPSTARFRLVAASIAIAAGFGILGGPAAPVQAAGSYMTTSWTPWTSPWSQGAQYWTVKAGTSVTMQCWTTGATRLNTAKWFYIKSNAYPYTRGYVPANAVGAQTIVGHC